MIDYRESSEIRLVLAGVFFVVMLFSIADLILDKPTTIFSVHILLELGLVAVSLSAVTYLARGWYRTRTHLREVEQAAEELDRERAAWRERAEHVIEGLGSAVASQFEAWSLTEAERRTALMLLKGLSSKRIARLTGTSERTVRQHAVAVYRKSGLAGRAELAGFFLEPLALPQDVEQSTHES